MIPALPPAPKEVFHYPFGLEGEAVSVPTQRHNGTFSFTITHGPHEFTIHIENRVGPGSLSGKFVSQDSPLPNPITLQKIDHTFFQGRLSGQYERIKPCFSFPKEYSEKFSSV